MTKITKKELNRSDYQVLNENELSTLKGGNERKERKELGCKFLVKVYQCLNIELTCHNSFTTGDCENYNVTCPKSVAITKY